MRSRPIRYPITPVPKPRQTQRDKWQRRPVVVRYRAYCDELRRLRVQWRPWDGFVFHMPMPKSWSVAKKEAHLNQPCKSKPDLDNLIKAVWDALFPDSDSHCHAIGPSCKIWSLEGAITVVPRPGQGEVLPVEGPAELRLASSPAIAY